MIGEVVGAKLSLRMPERELVALGAEPLEIVGLSAERELNQDRRQHGRDQGERPQKRRESRESHRLSVGSEQGSIQIEMPPSDAFRVEALGD